MTKIDSSSNRVNDVAIDTRPSAPPSQASTETPVLLPDANSQLECSGDPGAMLAALTMKMAKAQNETARAQRDQAMQAQQKADAAQIQDMRDKANLQRVQGLVDGAMQMAQGVCDVASGLNSISSASSKGDADGERDLMKNSYAENGDQRAAMADYANSCDASARNSDKAAAWDKFGASGFGAARSVADGCFNGAITDKDADAKAHEASASTFKQMADDAHDAENDAKTLLNKALDFYKEYVDTKNQTALAATHRA
jgi:hypothetical protein